MDIVRFEDIKAEIINNMRRQKLIPIIGSGFTRGCNSLNGTVPSGKEYKEHMVSAIASVENITTNESAALLTRAFSEVSTIYQKIVPINKQRDFLRDNFTCVQIDDPQKQSFINIGWPYIYTLNIDDGIEKNSKFSNVVYANRDVNSEVFTNSLCVIKLHGDANEILTYRDSVSQIFSQSQYVRSLKGNSVLLNKLTHDATYMNLLYVDCQQ